MLVLSFKYHKLGGYEVETDFYADYIVNTKKILCGDFSIDNFGFKGPLYYLLLAAFKLVFGEFFRAGLVLNVLSAGGVVFFIHLTVRALFGQRTAVLATLFSISSFAFLHYTYSVGTDMPACFFSVVSMYCLLGTKPSHTSVVLSGVFAGLAYLTRCNYIFMVPASIIIIFVMERRNGLAKKAFIASCAFAASYCFTLIPWLIPYWIVKRKIFPSEGLFVVNMQMETHSFNPYGGSTSIMDVITGDPLGFLNALVLNVKEYLILDFTELLHPVSGGLVAIGIVVWIVLAITGRMEHSMKKLSFFLFPLFHFGLLTLIHYNIRFSFFRLPFYSSLIFVPVIHFLSILKRTMPCILFSCLFAGTLLKFAVGYRNVVSYHEENPDPIEIFQAAEIINDYDLDATCGIMTRRPHLSYYTNLKNVMLPRNVRNFKELNEFIRIENVKFFWIDNLVISTCPTFAFMIRDVREYPGYTPVFTCPFGVLYRIDLD